MALTTLTIRPAVRADLSALLDLYQHLSPGDDRPGDAEAAQVLDRFQTYRGSAIFVGVVGERIVASCTLVVVPNLTRGGRPYGLIENVVTHGAFRQQGFGRRMLTAASDAAWKADCYKVMLMTGSTKSETLDFYLRAGFEQSKSGFQKRRIPIRSED